MGPGKDRGVLGRPALNARLRGVVVGTGYFSRFHLDAWSRTEGVEIVGLASLDAKSLTELADQYGIGERHSRVDALLDSTRPDFIDIATPPDSHAGIVAQAVERGIAILCQKPLAPTFDEACALVRQVESAGVRLMVHDNFRFQPWIRESRALLDAGAIGDLHSIACRTRLGDGWQPDAYLARQPYFRTMPRFLIHETGVHFLDVFRYLGGDITAVFARLRRLNEAIAGEDRAIVFCEHAGGATSLWDADRYHDAPGGDPRYTFGTYLVEGSRGSIRIQSDGTLHVNSLGQPVKAHRFEPSRLGFAGDSVRATFSHFVERLRSGLLFELEGRDYLRTLAAEEAAYRSASSGRLEPVSPTPPAG